MLKKKYRLRKTKEFERVYQEGKGVKIGFVALKFVKTELPNSRFGIIVSKKIANKAVKRNKIKRRLREAIRKHLPEIKDGFDIVIFAQPEICDKDFTQIEECLLKNLKKANLLK